MTLGPSGPQIPRPNQSSRRSIPKLLLMGCFFAIAIVFGILYLVVVQGYNGLKSLLVWFFRSLIPKKTITTPTGIQLSRAMGSSIWKGWVPFPAWARYSTCMGSCPGLDTDPTDGRVALYINTKGLPDNKPSPAMLASLEQFLQNQDTIRDQMLLRIVQFAQYVRTKDDTASNIYCAADLRQHLAPGIIHLYQHQPDQELCIGILFACDWEMDNGFGIVTRNGNVVGLGEGPAASSGPNPDSLKIGTPIKTMTILDNIQLTFDQSFSTWHGEIAIPAWAHYQSRQGSYTGKDSDAPSDGTVTLNINTEEIPGRKPSPAMLTALKYFLENQDAIRDQMLPLIIRYTRHIRDDYQEMMPRISSPTELKKYIGVGTVHIYQSNPNEETCIGLEFGCDWDEEHGMGVVTQKGTVVGIGQADTSFSGPDPESLKMLQKT